MPEDRLAKLLGAVPWEILPTERPRGTIFFCLVIYAHPSDAVAVFQRKVLPFRLGYQYARGVPLRLRPALNASLRLGGAAAARVFLDAHGSRL